jgi:hypothetical protein
MLGRQALENQYNFIRGYCTDFEEQYSFRGSKELSVQFCIITIPTVGAALKGLRHNVRIGLRGKV